MAWQKIRESVYGAIETVLGTISTTATGISAILTDIRTAVQIMDDWDQNDRAKTSPIPGQDGVEAAAGPATAKTIRTAEANDSLLTANSTATRNSLAIMDDWDQNDRAKTSPIPGQDGVAATAGAADALTQRIIPANDSPGLGEHDEPATTYAHQMGAEAFDVNGTAPSAIAEGDIGRILATLNRILMTTPVGPEGLAHLSSDALAGIFGVIKNREMDSDELGERFVEKTNQAVAVYRYIIDMEHFRYLTLTYNRVDSK